MMHFNDAHCVEIPCMYRDQLYGHLYVLAAVSTLPGIFSETGGKVSSGTADVKFNTF